MKMNGIYQLLGYTGEVISYAVNTVMTNKEALSGINKAAGLEVNLDPASITILPHFKRRQS